MSQASLFSSSFLLLLLGLDACALSLRLRQRSGLPAGHIRASDTGSWVANDELLYARDVYLVGKPDYLVETADSGLIPVEVKSRRAPKLPYESHVLQLAAYCYLVEQHYGERPFYGILQYSDRTFAIDYTDELEDELLDVIADMRADMLAGELDRDHTDWRRCTRCGFRQSCVQRRG